MCFAFLGFRGWGLSSINHVTVCGIFLVVFFDVDWLPGVRNLCVRDM